MGSYVQWIYHGEQSLMRDDNEVIYSEDENEEHDNDDEIHTMLEEASGRSFVDFSEETTGNNVSDNMSDKEAKKFDKLLKEAKCELYPGCKKFSKLSFVVKLLHLKVYNQWSNKSFDMLLELLKEALPTGATLHKSYYDAKNMLQGLGLEYISIHACKNDCVLYWAKHKDRQECPYCGTSRWKIDNGREKKIPHKVLRYFPLKPRLQRLFMSKKTSVNMRWHKEKHLDEENVLKHPADSEAWKEFDKNHPWFSQEPRNIRLGLVTDGFNPFSNMSTSYSMWPIILVPYNLPPWKCFKDPFMIMSLLIPGPQAPGKDIDVYLHPLIDELKDLWNDGVETFDASTGKCFKMHAVVLWTINDFPAYGKFLNYLLF
uniref:TNP2, partial n=1 Tax=Solanum tuberosum TaxID=4113 RepID=M1BNA0_SOLTU